MEAFVGGHDDNLSFILRSYGLSLVEPRGQKSYRQAKYS